MQTLEFTINIDASKDVVWNILWNDSTYREWTSVFSEGSYAETDWKEGSKVLFLSATGEGMYSTIARNIPNEFMSFKHLGMVKQGKEEPLDEETNKWSGAMENYTLQETNGSTELTVEIDIIEEMHAYFNEHFPKALEIVKDLSER